MKHSILLFFYGFVLITLGCQQEETALSEEEKRAIVASARLTVEKVFEYSNKLEFLDGLEYYSGDADALYTSNGNIITLDEMIKTYTQICSSAQIIENKIESWNATVLSKNTVAFTLPINLKIKFNFTPEYNGQLVWTGIVQKRNDKWMIIQSHESWLNCVEAAKTLSQSENNE